MKKLWIIIIGILVLILLVLLIRCGRSAGLTEKTTQEVAAQNVDNQNESKGTEVSTLSNKVISEDSSGVEISEESSGIAKKVKDSETEKDIEDTKAPPNPVDEATAGGKSIEIIGEAEVADTVSYAGGQNSKMGKTDDNQSDFPPTSEEDFDVEPVPDKEETTSAEENLFDLAKLDKKYTYEYYLNEMTPEEKKQLYNAAPSPQAFLEWVAEIKKEYLDARDQHITNAEEGITFD